MATLRKMSGNEMDNALRDKVGNIMNNIAFTTGEKVHLEWQHSTDGYNLYLNGMVSRENAILPFNLETKKELYMHLTTYSNALVYVYAKRRMDNKYSISQGPRGTA